LTHVDTGKCRPRELDGRIIGARGQRAELTGGAAAIFRGWSMIQHAGLRGWARGVTVPLIVPSAL